MEFQGQEHSNYQPSNQELYPSNMSAEGFLLEGQTLEQVLKRDKQALQVLGYTAKETADLLGPATEKAANGGDFEYTAPNGKQYDVVVEVYRGSQECPWRDKVDHKRSSGAMDMYFTEKINGGEPIRIAGLIRHLVEEHGFFEGGNYRVAPETIIQMFGQERVPGSLEKVKDLKL